MANLISLQRDMAEIYSAMHRQFSWVRNPLLQNLSVEQEAKIAIIDQESKEEAARIDLVVSIFGRLYDPACGWGKFWSCFYSVLICCRVFPCFRRLVLFIEEFRQKKTQKAVGDFFTNYETLQKEMQTDLIKIRRCLYATFTANADMRECLPEMQRIKKIHGMIYPFIKLMQRHRERTPTLFQNFAVGPFTVHEDFSWVREIYHLTHLIDLSEGNVPLHEIANLWRAVDGKETKERKEKNEKEKIEKNEGEQKIQEWLNRTFHSSPSLPLNVWQRKWIKGIRAITWLENSCKMEKDRYDYATLSRLSTIMQGIFLESGCSRRACGDKKCNRAFEPESNHLLWRSQLREGSPIPFNGKQITLGAPIDPKPNADFAVFNVMHRRDLIARIGTNRLQLEYMRYGLERKEFSNFPIRPVKCVELDRHGRVALFERVVMLDQLTWEAESKEKFEMTEKDKRKANLIGETIAKIISDPDYSPIPLTVHSLGFDSTEDSLVATRPLKRGAFDFDAVEEIFSCICKENAEIFKYLMEKSKMRDFKIAKFYQWIVRETLAGKTIDVGESTKIFGIANYSKKIIENGNALKNSTIDLRDRCCAQLHAQNSTADQKLLKSYVNEELELAYLNYGGSKIWEKFLLQEICMQVAAKKKLNWNNGA